MGNGTGSVSGSGGGGKDEPRKRKQKDSTGKEAAPGASQQKQQKLCQDPSAAAKQIVGRVIPLPSPNATGPPWKSLEIAPMPPNYKMLRTLLDDENFEASLSSHQNSTLVHRIVRNTLRDSDAEIRLRLEVLTRILRANRGLFFTRVDTMDQHSPVLQINAHPALLRFLIKHKLNLYAVSTPTQLSMIHACANYLTPHQFHDLVLFLKINGESDMFLIKTNWGLSILQYAVWKMEIKKETISAMFDSPEQLRFELNVRSKRKDANILMFAIEGGRSEELIRFLMERGAVPENDSEGYSVLHHAARCGNLGALRAFRHLNNSNLLAPGGLTPLHMALHHGSKNLHEVCEELLQSYRLYALIPDGQGRLPIVYARGRGCMEKEKPNLEIPQKTVDMIQRYTSEMVPLIGMLAIPPPVPQIGPSVSKRDVACGTSSTATTLTDEAEAEKSELPNRNDEPKTPEDQNKGQNGDQFVALLEAKEELVDIEGVDAIPEPPPASTEQAEPRPLSVPKQDSIPPPPPLISKAGTRSAQQAPKPGSKPPPLHRRGGSKPPPLAKPKDDSESDSSDFSDMEIVFPPLNTVVVFGGLDSPEKKKPAAPNTSNSTKGGSSSAPATATKP